MWVDIFPHDSAVASHFEQASEDALADEGIAIRQALCIGNAGTVEVRHYILLIFPDDFLRRWINFEHPRVWERLVHTMRAVVEEQHVPVIKEHRRVLTGERRWPELPEDGPGLAVDHDHRRDVAEA